MKKQTTLFYTFFVILLSASQVFSQETTSTYYFAHSLINHQKTDSNQANIPYWLAEIEKAAGDVALTSGQYAAGQFGANALPPTQGWSFFYRNQNHDSAMYPNDAYPINAHDNVVLTHMNWEIIYDYGPQLGERQTESFTRATDSIAVIFNWMDTNDPNAKLYLYECWPKIETDYILGGGDRWHGETENEPNATEWSAYLNYSLGKSNDFWVELQDNLINEKGFSDLKTIPSAMICAKLWQSGGILEDFTVTDVFEDDGPHGLASSYFLAAMVVYAAQHQEVPLRPFTSHPQIDQRLLDRYDQIATFIMTELSNFNFPNGSSRVWFAGADAEVPIQNGTLTANNIESNSADLNWDDATDNIRVTAYEIHINGALYANSSTSSYTLTDLNCNTAYANIQVRALDATGNTSSFISTSFTTATCPVDNEAPTVPTGLSVVRIDNNLVYITWNPSTDNYGVASYTLNINGNLTTQSGTAYTITDLNCEQVYEISILATDTNNNSSTTATTSYTNTCVAVYTLTLNYDEAMGNVQVAPTSGSTYQNGQIIANYEEGTTITFYRYPASGYQFDGYTGDLTSSEDPVSFTLNENRNITANFSPSTQADGTLLTWDFSDNSTTATAEAFASGLNTSTLNINTHLGAGSFGNGLEVLNFTSATLEEAITNGDYIHFTISPQSGRMVNISAVNIRPMSQNRERHFTLFSSHNGFMADNSIGNTTYMGVTSPLVEMTVPDHLNIETEVEFRIYIYGDNPNQYESAGLTGVGNDLEVIGTVENSSLSVNSESLNPSSTIIISPNPASNYVNIHTTEKDFEIQILNMLGQSVTREINNTKIDISNLPSGTYLVRLNGKSVSTQKTLIIK